MSLNLKIAVSQDTDQCFKTQRDIVDINQTNFTDVAAEVISMDDAKKGLLEIVKQTEFNIPVFLVI